MIRSRWTDEGFPAPAFIGVMPFIAFSQGLSIVLENSLGTRRFPGLAPGVRNRSFYPDYLR